MSEEIQIKKQSDETKTLVFDFTDELQILNYTGPSTITAAESTIVVWSGADSSSSSILSGSPSIVNFGPNVLQQVTGGVVDTEYKVKCQITTSDGRLLDQIQLLSIVNDMSNND